MQTVRVGGVPEHFNYPWLLGIETGIFEKLGVKVEFYEKKGGTGEMINSLKAGEVDIIIALTEGLIADIAGGSDLRIISTYVKSPLCWAVITGKDSKYNQIEDLKGQKFGISRYTSGSHLMVSVLALHHSWHPQNDVSFEVKGTFQNLRDGVNDNTTAAFLWEYFTTKPFKDKGEVRFIGDITTPWPCFMLAARTGYLNANTETVQKVLTGIRVACGQFHDFEKTSIQSIIAEKYGLQLQDAKEWYSNVVITGSSSIPSSAISIALDALYQTKVLPKKDYDLSNFVDLKFVSLERDIKSMKLYSKPELLKYLRNSLISIGKASGPLTYTDLLPYDQHHYHGIEALDVCVKECNISSASKVINVGSGLGGPARYLAGKYPGCQVLAVELQDDLNRTASELTERCTLSDSVHHVGGDFMSVGQHFKENAYDVIVSWLTVLHFANKEKLFQLCFSLLKPGGYFYAEDFFKLAVFSEEEIQILKEEVYCENLTDMNTYKALLKNAGFEIVKVEDLTEDWVKHTAERVAVWEKNKDQLLQLHREDTYKRLVYFYTKVRDLYKGGHLGGARFVARKPLQ